jgi:hypothetical protein
LKQRLELLSVIALTAIYLVWFAWPLFWSASDNARLVGTFNTDEEAHVRLLKEAIDSRFPRLGYIQYGYAYLNMGLLPLFFLSYLTDVTEQQIIVWLRMIPTIFAIATVALTFLMTRRYFSRLTAWLAVFLLSFAVLNFLEMSTISHSDIPQVFFLVLGVYFCCRLVEDGHSKCLIWASASAGFAFGCKYSGLFLLPVIGFYGLLHTVRLDATEAEVNSDRVIKVARILSVLTAGGLLIVGLVVVPHAAASYVDAEYFGVSIPQLFNSMRVISIVAGISLVLLAAVPVWAVVRQRPKLTYLTKLGMLAAITFGVAFFITSPFNVFSVRSGFMRGFLYESLHSGFGHEFEEAHNALLWFRILVSPELLDPLILGLAVLSLILKMHTVIREGWRQLFEPDSAMWVWVLFYFGFLIWRVNIRTHRALLPIIPFLLIFSAQAVDRIIQHATIGRSGRLAVGLIVIPLLAIVGLELPKSLDRIIEFRQTTSQREQTSDAVLAEHWLTEHYPPSTRILYDPYSYVPPRFTDAHVTPWGGTLEILETLEPDVVIINERHWDLFSDIREAATYSRDEAHFTAKYEYYEALREEKAGYVLIGDFGDVRIYTRP